VRARALRWRDRREALALLARAPLEHLYLLDLVDHLGRPPAPGEARPELLGVWQAGTLAGTASLRPSIALALEPEAVDAVLPFVEGVGTGLMKSEIRVVSRLWHALAARGRRALVDRTETAHVLEAGGEISCELPPGARLRAGAPADLPDLVEAARASLLEEKRPDPFDGDAEGFRRWVRGRLDKALVAELDGRVRFVAYADVRRAEGHLLQGVYTWPGWRRRGLARAGVAALCQLAFAEGAAHVQLAVVDGNVAGERLYADLGFRPFTKLRTILFST
jgi:RimJ/RimL family protein N-acetyltransferase